MSAEAKMIEVRPQHKVLPMDATPLCAVVKSEL